MKGQEYQYVGRIKELIMNYIALGKVSKLDALAQFSHGLITDNDIVSNIVERCNMHIYEGNGDEIVASVKSDLNSIILSDQRNHWQDFVKFYIKAHCDVTMAKHLENTVILCTPAQKQIINAFSNLCELGGPELMGASDLTAFFDSCEAAFGKEIDARKLLVGTGFANRWYYNSTSLKHPAWDIPDWASTVSHDIAQNPGQFGISANKKAEMERELKQEKAIAFISWLSGKTYDDWKGIIEWSEWQEGKQNFESHFELGSFDTQLGDLVKTGVISIISAKGRKFDGFGVYINPDAFSLIS